MKINLLGGSGCGTSTLGRALATSLEIPHFESDDYYHGPSDPPFQNPRSPQERYDLLMRDLGSLDAFVLSGGIAGWQPYPQLNFSCFVFLHAPVDVRLQRLRQRESERFGSRIRPGGDMCDAHEEFIAWAAKYDTGDVSGKTRARHEAYLQQQESPVICLNSEGEISQLRDQVLMRLLEL